MKLRVGIITAGLFVAALAGPAQATINPSYFFNIAFNSGALSGQTITGGLEVNGAACPGGICSGVFSHGNGNLLSLNVTLGGVSFAMANDTGFSSGFPDVTFNSAGRLSQIDYQGQVTSGLNTYVLDLSNVNLGVDLAAFYQGTVGSPTGLVSTGVVRAVVPEPGTVALLGIAALGLAFAWRRKTSAHHNLPVDALAS
jgi:hypothetical protein